MSSPLSGIINFHKPIGITSAKAVYNVRAVTHQRKSGHAGTLDPGASGVLVLCLGRATKWVEEVMDQPKWYRATARLDVVSESHDSDRPLTPISVAREPSPEELREALRTFEGRIMQTPPRISAIKIGGAPAYRRERGDEPFVLEPRPVTIHWIHLRQYVFPRLEFEMCCGRGTYVRSLIRDVGAKLQTGGCLDSLARLCVGPFSLDQSVTLDMIQQSSPEDYVIELDRAVAMLDPSARVIPPRPG